MTYLPATPVTALVTRDGFQTEMRSVRDEIRSVRDELAHLSHRVDLLQLTLLAGFMSMIVTLIVVGFFG
ncbi:MAG: hypothetical protein ACRDZM_01235 [Acidimicrobiia bacterium]